MNGQIIFATFAQAPPVLAHPGVIACLLTGWQRVDEMGPGQDEIVRTEVHAVKIGAGRLSTLLADRSEQLIGTAVACVLESNVRRNRDQSDLNAGRIAEAAGRSLENRKKSSGRWVGEQVNTRPSATSTSKFVDRIVDQPVAESARLDANTGHGPANP